MATERCKGSHCERFAQRGKELCERCEKVLLVNIPLRDCPGHIHASLELPSTWKFHDDEENDLRKELEEVIETAISMAMPKGITEEDMPEQTTAVWNTRSAHSMVYDE